MATGDAFARFEVASIYVRPKSRFVVSLIVGVDDEEDASPERAIQRVLEMTRSNNRGGLSWFVLDRETGILEEISQDLFDESISAEEESQVKTTALPDVIQKHGKK